MIDSKADQFDIAYAYPLISFFRKLFHKSSQTPNSESYIFEELDLPDLPVDQIGEENLEKVKEILDRFSESWVPIPLFKIADQQGQTILAHWAKLVLMMPHQSVDDESKIAYYPTFDHLIRDRQVRTSIGKFWGKVFGNTNEQVSQIYTAWTGVSSVKFVENNQADDWVAAYASTRVSSCMTGEEAVKVYAAESFGLPDNGLRLAYMGLRPAGATARAVVHEPTKSFCCVYGDSSLRHELEAQGYKDNGDSFYGVHLAVVRVDDDPDHYFMPFLDVGGVLPTINEHGQEVFEIDCYDEDYDDGVREADSTCGILTYYGSFEK